MISSDKGDEYTAKELASDPRGSPPRPLIASFTSIPVTAIQTLNGQFAWDLANNIETNGNEIRMWPFNNTAAQRWRLENVDDSTLIISHAPNPNKVIEFQNNVIVIADRLFDQNESQLFKVLYYQAQGLPMIILPYNAPQYALGYVGNIQAGSTFGLFLYDHSHVTDNIQWAYPNV